MSTDANTPAPPRRDDPDAAAAADPTTPSVELARIVSARPDLQAAIAANPAATPGVLDFIMRFGTADAKSAVFHRGKPSGATASSAPSAALAQGPGPQVGPAIQAGPAGQRGWPPQSGPQGAPVPAGYQVGYQAGLAMRSAPATPAVAPVYGAQPPMMPAPYVGGVAGAATPFATAGAPRKRRGGLIAAVVVLVLVLGAGGAGGAWWWLHRDESAGAKSGRLLGTTEMSTEFSKEPDIVWSRQANLAFFSEDGTRMLTVGDLNGASSAPPSPPRSSSRSTTPDLSYASWELFSLEGDEPRSIASGEGADATKGHGFWDQDAVIGNVRVNGTTGEQTTLDWLDDESKFVAGAGDIAVAIKTKGDRSSRDGRVVGVSADGAEKWRFSDHEVSYGWRSSASTAQVYRYDSDKNEVEESVVDIATGTALGGGKVKYLRARPIADGVALYFCADSASQNCEVSAYKNGQTTPFDTWDGPYIGASPEVSAEALKKAGADMAGTATSGFKDDTYALDSSGAVHSVTRSTSSSPKIDGHDLERPADVGSSAAPSMEGVVGDGSLVMIRWWDGVDLRVQATSVHDAATGEVKWSMKDSRLVRVVAPKTILTETSEASDDDLRTLELRRVS